MAAVSRDNKYSTLCLLQHECHQGPIWCCSFAGGNHFITGSVDETVKIWNIKEEHRIEQEGVLYEHSLGAVCIDVYESLLVSSSMDSCLRVFDLNTQQLIRRIPPDLSESTELSNTVSAVDPSPSGSSDNSGGTWMCAFSPDGKLIATAGGGAGTSVDLYSVQSRAKLATLKSPSKHKFILNIAPSPCGRFLACSTTSGSIVMFDMSTLRVMKTLEHHAMPVRGLAFSPNCQMLATGSDDGLIKLYENYVAATVDSAETGIPPMTLVPTDGVGGEASQVASSTGWIVSLHFSSNSKYLACGTAAGCDSCVRIWDMTDTSPISDDYSDSGELPEKDAEEEEDEEKDSEDGRIHRSVHNGHIWAVKFDNSHLLASVGADQSVALYE